MFRNPENATTITPEKASKIYAEGKALYDLYQIFGRGDIREEQWIALYLKGDLPKYMNKRAKELGIPVKGE